MRRAPRTIRGLETLGRVRLSNNFFLRDFLMSEIAAIQGFANVPDDPGAAIWSGTRLCQDLLEPLHATFGRVAIRSGYRSPEVNGWGNANGFNCATNEKDRGGHIWDQVHPERGRGAAACIVLPWFADRYAATGDWRPLAWWIHDHLPYSWLMFFPKYAAFNIGWHEHPQRTIYSYVPPRGWLTKPGMANHDGRHADLYPGFPKIRF